MYELSKSRCNELAALPKLNVHHFIELTGIGICKGGSFDVTQEGVFPRQYSNHDLHKLTNQEQCILLEQAHRPPLETPFTQMDLLRFIDGSIPGSFEVPVEFRRAVETPTPLEHKVGGTAQQGPKVKSHIAYLAHLVNENPSASAKDLERLCLRSASDEGSPFEGCRGSLVLRGKPRPIESKTFSNWVTDARKLT